MGKISKKLGEILVEGGIVTRQQLEKALELQKKNKKLLGEIIVELGYITKDRLELALTRQFGSMLGEILMKNKLISFEQLQNGLKSQRETNKPLGQILIGLSYLSEEELLKALSIQYKIPYINLSEYKIKMEALNKVPIAICRQCNILPIDIEEGNLVIATANPEDILIEQNIRALTGMMVKVVIASSKEIKRRISP